MTTLPELIHESLSGFSGHLSDFLQQQGINTQQLWRPPVDILENDEVLMVCMNIAGVPCETIDVDFFNNNINIKGERKPPALVSSDDVIQRRREILYGKFERKVTLPISITQRESVTINLEDGVLSIIIDKTKEIRNKFSLKVEKPSIDTKSR